MHTFTTFSLFYVFVEKLESKMDYIDRDSFVHIILVQNSCSYFEKKKLELELEIEMEMRSPTVARIHIKVDAFAL